MHFIETLLPVVWARHFHCHITEADVQLINDPWWLNEQDEVWQYLKAISAPNWVTIHQMA